MKVVIIGDIHGRTIWNDIVEKEKNADMFVFLGDYLDPYEYYLPRDIYDNFLNIINFKLSNPDRVTLLVGNHDSSYFADAVRCRFSKDVHTLIGSKFLERVLDETFQFCYKIPTKRYQLYCLHAGLTNTWLRDHRMQINQNELNNYFVDCAGGDHYRSFDFIDKGNANCYGDNVYQSPLWVRPNSLKLDKPYGIYQIVGHTQGMFPDNKDNVLGYINYCDSLEKGIYWIYEEDNGTDYRLVEKFYSVKLE